MSRKWSSAEIGAMERADREIEAGFRMTMQEIREARERDKFAAETELTDMEAERKRKDREYQRRYYREHRDALRENAAKWYRSHRKERIEREKAWQEQNTEYLKLYHAAYYDENRDRILARKQSEYAVEKAYKTIMRELEAEQA